MKANPDKTAFKEYLRLLRPDLRPSLADKESHKFLCWLFGEFWRHSPESGQWLTPEQIKKLQPPEDLIERRVLEWELHFKTHGFDSHHRSMIESLRDKYSEWRKCETSRQRAESARKKAAKQKQAKEDTAKEAERIKTENKLARRKKPHFTTLVDVEKELDRRSLEDFLAQ